MNDNLRNDMQRHALLHARDHWGHNKPLVALAVRMVEARADLVVTIITTSVMYHKIVKELFKVYKESIISQIRIIDIASNKNDVSEPRSEFAAAFELLLRSEPLICLSSHKMHEGLPPPCVAVIDSFASYAVDAIGKRIPVLMWRTSPAGSILRHNGPPELGGRTQPDSPSDVTAPSEGPVTVVQIPGGPPMYDYEWTPQEVAYPLSLSQTVWEAARRVVQSTDGVLNVSCSAYEPGAVTAAEDWYKSMGKAWYAVGPLSLPPNEQAAAVTTTQEIQFLDKMKGQFGEKSVIYIAFGSSSWLPLPDKLWIIIDELIAHRLPFLLAHPSRSSEIPDDHKMKINDSGIGLEMEWVDQEAVLSHPATGWFITHGGWNSLQEAFVHKVPCIFLPFSSDQPYNAAMITLNHRAGFEFLSVRRKGSKPPFRCNGASCEDMFTDEALKEEMRGLLVQLKGHEGQRVRNEAESLGRAMLNSWNEGQESARNLERFLGRFVDQVS